MLRQMIFTSLLTISSVLALVNPAPAQTTDPQVNRLLQQSNQAVGSANRYMNNVAIPEAQKNQIYMNQLYQYCLRGNGAACQQYRSLAARYQQQQIFYQQQYTNWLNNRRY